MSARWDLGVWVGKAGRSDEHLAVRLEDSVVVRCRSVRCFPEAEAWDGGAVDSIRVRAWESKPSEEEQEVREPSAALRPVDTEFSQEEVRRLVVDTIPRNLNIMRKDRLEFGFAANCSKCQAILLGRVEEFARSLG